MVMAAMVITPLRCQNNAIAYLLSMTDTEEKAHLLLQHPGTQSNSTATTI